MVLNVTEEQKKLVESQGYMVVEFKLWCKKLSEYIAEAFHRLIEDIEAVILFLHDMMLRVFDNLKELSGKIAEEFRTFVDKPDVGAGVENEFS